jgi:hypothetical protein
VCLRAHPLKGRKLLQYGYGGDYGYYGDYGYGYYGDYDMASMRVSFLMQSRPQLAVVDCSAVPQDDELQPPQPLGLAPVLAPDRALRRAI